MGVFKKAKINEAKLTQGGVYFNPGFHYLLSVHKMHIVETRDKGDMFVADFQILESDDPNRKVGTKASFAQLLNNDMAGINIKSLLVALSGIDRDNEAEINDNDWDEVAESSIQDDQPFKDEKVNLETYSKVTKKTRDLAEDKQKTVTVHNWSPFNVE
jgi:hypothetical protein